MAHADDSPLGTAQLPRGDVIQTLLEQHARIRELFTLVRSSSGEVRQRYFDDLRRLLVVHEVAEETIVRPVTRAAATGGRVASARNSEEGRATRLLARLESVGASSPHFRAGLAELEASVLEHAKREEADEFPLLLASRSEQQRAWMGAALRVVEALAPTHAHPGAAGSTLAQLVLGPIASVADHARDAAKWAMAR